MITLWHYLAVAAALFGIGLVGFLTRRNLITMFLCAEMMLQGVAINLVAFARYHGTCTGRCSPCSSSRSPRAKRASPLRCS